MNAKESEKMAEVKQKAFEAQKEKDRIKAEILEEYIRNGAIEFCLKEFNEKYLPEAILKNKRSVVISTGHPITCDLVKKRLVEDGYTVSFTEEKHHDSYSGSIDDGFAYARDAYIEWSFTVSW